MQLTCYFHYKPVPDFPYQLLLTQVGMGQLAESNGFRKTVLIGSAPVFMNAMSSFSALFLNEIEKPMQQAKVGIPIPFVQSVGRVLLPQSCSRFPQSV